jgi:peptide/nickel transport system substrate-binding protein
VKKLLIPIGILLIAAFILSGCSSSNTSVTTAPASSNPPSKTTAATAFTTTASPTVQPQYGGTLKVVLGYGFGTNFGNPVVSGMTAITSFYGMCVGESLTNFDNKGNVIPMLAESWDMDNTAKTITFHLRKGIKFHDGTDFDADAVKWNLDVRIARGAISGSDQVQSIDVVDKNTVKVTFKVFSAINLISLTHVQFMYSPTAYKANGDDWAKLHPIGTGPFKIVDAKVDAYAKFVRNDNYWNGKPYLDGIEFTVIPDSMVAQAMMFSKQADMWCETTTAKDAQTAKEKGLSVFSRVNMINYLCPDSANPGSPYANKKVREAVEYAIDKKQIVETFTLGFGEAIYQFSPSITVNYLPEYKGRLYDPAKAKQLLAEAGYANGFKTKMMTTTGQSSRDLGTAVQGFLSAVGIEMTLDPADGARYTDAMNNGWKEGIWYGGHGINPGLSAVQFLASNFRPLNQKPSMARSAEFLDVYNKLSSVPDLTTATELGKQMNTVLTNDVTAIPLYSPAAFRITQPYVHVNYLDIHHRVWDVNLSWMDKH